MPYPSHLMPLQDNRAALAVKRAVDQIGHALGEHGLYVTVDADGNFGVDRLPADVPIKGERISDWIRRLISDGYRRNKPVNGVRLNDEETRRFASELADLNFNCAMSEAEIYDMIAKGDARFMDVKIMHYWG